MLSFFKPKTRRIILINLEGLSVYALEDEQLILRARFTDEDTGHENFRQYLEDNPKTGVTILLDSVAEDFIVENVPHVRYWDRQALLKRKAAYHFRGIDYRSAKVVGRDSKGRREDKVLFSAITRNQALEPWVRNLLLEEIPINGITTPAFALAKIAQSAGLLTSERVLLLNWEVSGLRHTFVKRGKIVFSRLTPAPDEDDGDVGRAVVESCNQSNDYLEGIGLLGFDESVDVHLISPHLLDDVFENIPSTLNFSSLQHHNSARMMGSERFRGPESAITAILLCLDWGVREGEFPNIYAPAPALRFKHLRFARRQIYTAGLAFIMLAGLVASPTVLDALRRENRIEQLNALIAPRQLEYDDLTSQFPETPIPIEAMELAVDTYTRFSAQRRNPNQMLAQVSSVLNRYPNIELTSIAWQEQGRDQLTSTTQALLDNEMEVVLDIFGLLRGSNSIGNSDRELRQIMSDLDALPGVVVVPLDQPVEGGPEGEVNTIIADGLMDVQFGIRLTREVQS